MAGEGRCISEGELWAIFQVGLLRMPDPASIERHVDRCGVCRKMLAGLAHLMPAGIEEAEQP